MDFSFSSLFLSLFYFLISVLLLSYLSFRYNCTFKGFKRVDGKPIPGPKPVFPFGNALDIAKTGALYKTIEKWRKEYGDEFQFWLLGIPSLYVHDLETMKKVCSEVSYRGIESQHEIFCGGKGIAFNNNLPHHKTHRKVILTNVLKPSYQHVVSVMINNLTDKLLQILDKENSGKDSFEIEISSKFSCLTLDIIGKAACSLDLKAIEGSQSSYQKYAAISSHYLLFLSRIPKFLRPFSTSYKIFLDAISKVKNILKEVVEQRIEEKKKGLQKENDTRDMLDALLEENDPNTNEPYPIDDIIYDLQDLFAAGHKSTSSSLTIAFYFLSLNPKWQEEVRKECDKFGSSISYEEVNPQNMPYLNATFKESLRLHAVVPNISRMTPVPTTVANKYQSPAEGIIWMSNYLIGHDPQHFAFPNEFRPERWLEREDSKLENNPFSSDNQNAFIGFGMGYRACVGTRMANLEAKIVMCKILQKYVIKPPLDKNFELKFEEGVTLKPIGVPLILEKRN